MPTALRTCENCGQRRALPEHRWRCVRYKEGGSFKLVCPACFVASTLLPYQEVIERQHDTVYR